jgi:hypothetical protein
MRTVLAILIVCAFAGCSSAPKQAAWPVDPKAPTPNNITVVTNGPAGVTAFRVNLPPPVITPAAPENPLAASDFQDYDREMIKAIQKRWRELRSASATPTNEAGLTAGKVVVEFRLHADGRISDLKTVSTKVNNALTYLCEEAVADPEPYARWPEDMARKVGAESRVVRFTFDY